MEITASHKYTYKSYKKFFKLTIGWLNYLFIALEIILAINIIISLFGLVFGGSDIISLVMFILLEIFWIAFHLYFPRLSYKKTSIAKDASDNYVFYDDKLLVKSESKGVSSEGSVEYKVIKKVYETGEMFYVYISQQQAFIVEKATIAGGTADDIRNLLIKSVGQNKYKFKV